MPNKDEIVDPIESALSLEPLEDPGPHLGRVEDLPPDPTTGTPHSVGSPDRFATLRPGAFWLDYVLIRAESRPQVKRKIPKQLLAEKFESERIDRATWPASVPDTGTARPLWQGSGERHPTRARPVQAKGPVVNRLDFPKNRGIHAWRLEPPARNSWGLSHILRAAPSVIARDLGRGSSPYHDPPYQHLVPKHPLGRLSRRMREVAVAQRLLERHDAVAGEDFERLIGHPDHSLKFVRVGFGARLPTPDPVGLLAEHLPWLEQVLPVIEAVPVDRPGAPPIELCCVMRADWAVVRLIPWPGSLEVRVQFCKEHPAARWMSELRSRAVADVARALDSELERYAQAIAKAFGRHRLRGRGDPHAFEAAVVAALGTRRDRQQAVATLLLRLCEEPYVALGEGRCRHVAGFGPRQVEILVEQGLAEVVWGSDKGWNRLVRLRGSHSLLAPDGTAARLVNDALARVEAANAHKRDRRRPSIPAQVAEGDLAARAIPGARYRTPGGRLIEVTRVDERGAVAFDAELERHELSVPGRALLVPEHLPRPVPGSSPFIDEIQSTGGATALVLELLAIKPADLEELLDSLRALIHDGVGRYYFEIRVRMLLSHLLLDGRIVPTGSRFGVPESVRRRRQPARAGKHLDTA